MAAENYFDQKAGKKKAPVSVKKQGLGIKFPAAIYSPTQLPVQVI